MSNRLKACLQAIIAYLRCHELARVATYAALVHGLLLAIAISGASLPKKEPTSALLCVKTVRLAPGVKISDRTSSPKTQAQQAASQAKPIAAAEPPSLPTNQPLESPKEAPVKEEPALKPDKKLEKIKTMKSEVPAKKPKDKPPTAPKKDDKDAIAKKNRSPTPKSTPVDSKKVASALSHLNKINTQAPQVSSSSSSSAPSSVAAGDAQGSGNGPMTISYEDAISQFLRLWVRLPEYGQVKIKITLDPAGRVVELKTLSWESETNRQFVEERLPKLTFPVDGNQNRRQANKTLTLVMRNE